jgi:hypothetical protein
VLVDEDRIPVRIDGDEARGPPGALVGFRHELHSVRLELSLELAHVGERVELGAVAVFLA